MDLAREAVHDTLLDSGPQIGSMTWEVAAANKITWDPSLSIQLQSANGSLSRTCGLAKNVPFIYLRGRNGASSSPCNGCGTIQDIIRKTL